MEKQKEAAGKQKKEAKLIQSACICKVLKYIDENLADDLSPDTISMVANMSPGYLHHIFKSEMGISLMKYVKARRMDKSMELIKCSKIGITEIAYITGVSNSQYFSTLFKQHTGMTPRDYRSRMAGIS